MVFVKDLARAIITCLEAAAASRRTYYVAAPEITSARALAAEIARLMTIRTVALSLPAAWLWPICAAQEVVGRWQAKPGILSRMKYPELRAPGWVCDPARIRADLGFVAATGLREGLAETLEWYRGNHWL